MTTREGLIVLVSERMVGSPESAQHTHIECHCPGLVHRKEEYEDGCFCPPCASKAATALGLAATDTEPEGDGPDDHPRWCEECDTLITSEITPDGAEEELAHFATKTPDLGAFRRLGAMADAHREPRGVVLCLVYVGGSRPMRPDDATAACFPFEAGRIVWGLTAAYRLARPIPLERGPQKFASLPRAALVAALDPPARQDPTR